MVVMLIMVMRGGISQCEACMRERLRQLGYVASASNASV